MTTCSTKPMYSLTKADAEFDRMHYDAVFVRRVYAIKEEDVRKPVDDKRPKPKKKNGKRVSWGPTQVKEITRTKELMYGTLHSSCSLWQHDLEKQTAGVEKMCEQFWERGIGHRYRWTINEKRWRQCCKIDDEMDELIAKEGVDAPIAKEGVDAPIAKEGIDAPIAKVGVWDIWDESVFKGGLL